MFRRTIVFGDVHIPFHDPKIISGDARGLILDIAHDIKIDRILINGDLLDMYGVNMHGPKSPIVHTTIEDELVAGREFFHALRERFPDTEIVLNMGNHEHRLNRFITQHCKSFHNLLRIEKFLELDRLGIEWYPYQHKYQIDGTSCFVMHSPPSYGVNGARTSLLKKMDETYLYGCTHREQQAHLTASSGNVYSAYFVGWCGSSDLTPEHREVFSYAKGHQNWQRSFAIVNTYEGQFHVNTYSIRDYSCVVDGFLYKEE